MKTALALLSLAWLAWPTSVSAHAELAGSDPAIDGQGEQVASAVTLWFTERPEPRFSEIQVLDSAARRVDRGEPRPDPTDPLALRTPVGALEKGTYTVVWKALSSVDGHVTRGAFAFTVGLDQTPTGSLSERETPPITARPEQVLTQILTWGGTAAALGGMTFLWLVLLPALRGTASIPLELLRRSGKVAVGGSVLAGSGTAAELVLQAAETYGIPFAAAIGEPSLTVAAGTRFGALWITRMVFIVVLGGLAARLLRGGGVLTLQVGALVGAASLWMVALGSHSAAAPGSTGIAIFAQWLHLLAMAVWIGGLIHLFGVLQTPTGQEKQLLGQLVPRFSSLALGCVVVLAGTGIYQSKLLVGPLQALVTTPFGNSLMIKLILVAGILGIAAINLLMIRPRLQRGLDAAGSLRWTVAAELTLVVGILAVTGALTNLQPAREVAVIQGVTVEARAEDVRARLRVQPAAVGSNRLELTLTNRQGEPLSGVERVTLRLSTRTLELGESELNATDRGSGRFTAQTGALVIPGPWRIETVIRRPGLADARPAFDVAIGPPLQPGPLAFAAPVEEGNAVIGLELLVLGVALAGLAALRWRGKARIIVPPAIGMAAVGALISTASLSALASTIRNPIPPTEASVLRGQSIYVGQCAVCHGDNGRGDGPLALGLNPRPADLRVHLAAGHTDAQLYDWVTNGYPGSAMPAFKDQLSDEDRWHVLNFIRVSFGPGVPTR